jgi:carbon-monoxide dehydrogenase medium subunit
VNNFDYLEPKTVTEACRLLREYNGDAKIFAGGAHLTILMKQRLLEPKVLINIKRITALNGIQLDAKRGLTIGALVTHREIETSAAVRESFPVLAEAEREVANIRVRNMGTIGGNLASGEPLTDLPQIFIALDGKVKIARPGGNRTVLVQELFVDLYETSLAPDEILTHVALPPLPPRSGIEYIRFSSSSVVDKPAVGVAVRVTLQKAGDACKAARIVLGCVGPTPARAAKAEELTVGNPLSPELLETVGATASQECSPIADLRGSERYKRAIIRTLVKRAAARAYERALAAS